jgi:two-component sensor histidine kinase
VIEKKQFIENLCDGFTTEQRLIIRGTEETLLAISRTQSILNHDYQTLNRYLADVMKRYPSFSVFLVADSHGLVVSSGVDKRDYSIEDRDYFQKVKKTGEFTVGTFVVSRSTGINVLPFALPVTDRTGATVYLVGVYNLEKYFTQLSLSRLSGHDTLEILDSKGQRLFSSASGTASLPGQPVEDDLFSFVKEKKNQTGSTAKVLLGGEPYLVSSNVVTGFNMPLYITVRTPYRAVLDESRKPALVLLSSLLLSCLFAFVLSFWFARKWIVERIEKLTGYTQELAAGNLRVRSDPDKSRDEIADLMKSFNSMASAIEERSLARQKIIGEKEELVQELHKRVTDNLQILSSLVSLQIEYSDKADVRHVLITTHSRIMALSLVYETIFHFPDVQTVPLELYCKELSDYLVSVYSDVGSNIVISVSGDSVSLPLEKAIPLGLILNELVSNSLLHAFPDGSDGNIRIHFELSGSARLKMLVSDDGIGVEGEIHKNKSLGYQMIQALVDQLGGTLQVENNQAGYEVSVIFLVPQ